MAVYRLDNELWFPDPHLGEKNGLVAVGGDLSVERLLLAYSNGFSRGSLFEIKKNPIGIALRTDMSFSPKRYILVTP